MGTKDGAPILTSQTSIVRWAGYAILISGLIILVNITLFGAFFGNVPAADPTVGPTPVERAAHLSEQWVPLSTLSERGKRPGDQALGQSPRSPDTGSAL